jgi:hypothetical protein
MKKIFLNESERLKLISEKEKMIIESFAKTFNEIKRIDENEINTPTQIDEGIKNWITGGLITLSTIGGIGKVYQLNQEAAKQHKIEMKYYDDVLSDKVRKMDDKELAEIGFQISDKTKKLQASKSYSSEEWTNISSYYAEDYIKSHPKEFGINQNGDIEWLGPK